MAHVHSGYGRLTPQSPASRRSAALDADAASAQDHQWAASAIAPTSKAHADALNVIVTSETHSRIDALVRQQPQVLGSAF